MAIAFVDSTHNSGNSNVSMTIPLTASAGQVAISITVADAGGGTATSSPPAGWTAITNGSTIDFDDNERIDSWYRVLQAGDPGTSGTWTNTDTGSQFFAAAILVYSGVLTSSPIDVATHNTGSPSTNLVASSLTPSQAGDMVIVAYGHSDSTSTSFTLSTTPAGTTQREVVPYVNNSNYGLWTGEQLLSGTGATGTYTGTLSSAFDWSALTILLNPAPPATVATNPPQPDSPSGGIFVIRSGAWN